MSIQNARQLAVTRKKLQLLEDSLGELETSPVANPTTREWTRRSLKKMINQMKEEIAVFTARQATPAK